MSKCKNGNDIKKQYDDYGNIDYKYCCSECEKEINIIIAIGVLKENGVTPEIYAKEWARRNV